MSAKSKKATIAAAPIASAEVAEVNAAPKVKTYTMRLPKETRDRAETYIVPKGPMGVERWMAKKSYTVASDASGLYATLSQSQADYYLKTLPAGSPYMPKENA